MIMDRFLVTYGTWAGSTKSVAEIIKKTLEDDGLRVDLLQVDHVSDLSPYRGVIIGTGIHAGHPHRHMVQFVKKNRTALSKIPVAYFIVCLTMKKDTEENRRVVRAYLDKLIEKTPEAQPIDIGLFAGAVLTQGEEYERLGFLFKKILKKMAKEGDHRDWDAIRKWAHMIGLKISKQ